MPTAYYKILAKSENELRAVDNLLVNLGGIRISKRRIKPKIRRGTILVPGAKVIGPHCRN